MEFLITNGKVTGKNEINLNYLLIEPSVRLSQKVWYGYGGIPFFAENLKLMKAQTEAIQLPFPKEFENDRELYRITKRMLNKNKFYRSGYVHFDIFWKENLSYTLVTANAFEQFDFPFNQTGLLVAFSEQFKQTQNPYNRFPFFNENIWQTGLATIRQTPSGQIIFLNEKKHLCEGAKANVFLIKNNELFTPHLNSGCYNDILRPVILEIAQHIGLTVFEKEVIEKQSLFEMDEIFFASESNGIQWVLGIENTRYLQFYSKKIKDKIDELLDGKPR